MYFIKKSMYKVLTCVKKYVKVRVMSMKKTTSKLKKKIGEKIYNFLSRNFSEEFLEKTLPSTFGVLSDMRYIREEDFDGVKIILNDIENRDTEIQETPKKTAKEILDSAGYELFDNIRSKKDYAAFKKYYKESELLCKFKSYDATQRYSRIFFLVKKGAEKIKRSDNPKRQDEYSTSVMSVGVSKDKKNISQICSRYNHTVNGCDNTFNSNLDLIVEGLTDAFNRDYGLNIANRVGTVELNNFYVSDGKYYHYHREINGHKIGDFTVDGCYYNPDTYFIFEYFILDLKQKTIKSLVERDGFVELVKEKLEYEKS